ncbi:PREDICTED: neuropeptide FF receptor 2 [Drosophila arizonae]|uniref:Neuropeptide FF receptor 2 n=1 Tax=Drosophila arizonae TaxID=7263 RepID=A0ABM1PGZ7_DROAR|nr:PREDICTED: neuropeptide FF receptor 2 [Drosophila arizonae]
MDAHNYSSIQFDFSQWDFPAERIWRHKAIEEIAWKVCSFLPLIIFGLYANYILIYLIATNRALRSPTNLIIANMAMADLLTLLICPVMFLINDFYQNFQLGCVGCKLEGFLVVVFLITAVLNLSVVSYDRLTAIVLPQETRLTLHGAKIVITCTWLTGLLLALPLAIYREYRVRIWRNFTERYCKENTNVLPKYWYVLITVLVWLPLSIMLICYTAIFIKLDRYEKRVLSRENPLTVSYKRSVAKTLFIVVVVFVVLRLPFTIFVVQRERSYKTAESVGCGTQYFSYFSQYLMFVNAAVNPIVYGFNNENFRRAYAQIGWVKRRRAASAKRAHSCCYCDFVKNRKGAVVKTEQNLNKDISQSAAEETKNLEETTDNLSIAKESLVTRLNSDGFI